MNSPCAVPLYCLYCLCPVLPVLQDYSELVAQFKRQELLLYQYTEEKVTLAHHALDLVTQQQKDLERVRRLKDLATCHVLAARRWLAGYNILYFHIVFIHASTSSTSSSKQ